MANELTTLQKCTQTQKKKNMLLLCVCSGIYFFHVYDLNGDGGGGGGIRCFFFIILDEMRWEDEIRQMFLFNYRPHAEYEKQIVYMKSLIGETKTQWRRTTATTKEKKNIIDCSTGVWLYLKSSVKKKNL